MCADCVGGGRQDALHRWTECSATRDLVGEPARGPIKWSKCQLSRFLREPSIAELLDHDGSEHPGVHPGQSG